MKRLNSDRIKSMLTDSEYAAFAKVIEEADYEHAETTQGEQDAATNPRPPLTTSDPWGGRDLIAPVVHLDSGSHRHQSEAADARR